MKEDSDGLKPSRDFNSGRSEIPQIKNPPIAPIITDKITISRNLNFIFLL